MFQSLLDYVCPRPCIVCGNRLAVTEKEICTVCNWHLPRTDFASSPYDNPLARLFWGQLPVERATALIYYYPHSLSSNLIYDAKYHGRTDVCHWLGQTLAREYKEESFFDGIDAIVPMPLTRWRRWQRGYNQSKEIARGIASVCPLPIIDKAVKRLHFKASQTKLNALERKENVKDNFRLVRPELIRGKHILLVDDVITTGSTILACGSELAKAGDVRISIMAAGFTKS